MVRRPKEWGNWTQEERMAWLRKQRTEYKGGRKGQLTKEDKQRVWVLMKEHQNMSLVADLLEVDRTTVWRFLKRFPIPKSFVLQDSTNLEDFPEIQIWKKREVGFAKKRTLNNYVRVLRRFYEWMKQHHPQRAKPSLWTSEDVTEYIYGNESIGWKGFEPYQWHDQIIPLRSLADKAPKEFPHIDLGLLPTKKTHRAKRSLAGKTEYYLDLEQIQRMIEVADGDTQKRDRALIAMIFNMAIRTTAATRMCIEDLDLDNHMVRVKDKGDITWLVHGLADGTIQLIREYLEERGYPRSGWLFVNGGGRKLRGTDVNKIIRTLGKQASIEGKVLTAKVFRKSLAKIALTPVEKGGLGMNPVSLIGTGKGTKTCFCVGWTEIKVLMEHYAPALMEQIEMDRQKFLF